MTLPLRRSLLPVSTMYRHIRTMEYNYRDEIQRVFGDGSLLRLHWLDNFCKSYAANDMYINELLKNRYWTAHGFKLLPSNIPLDWTYDGNGSAVPALPVLKVLLANKWHDRLLLELGRFERLFLADSIAVVRDR